MKSTVLFVWFLLSILKKCAIICTLLFSRPEVCIGQRLLNNQDCYCSFHPSNSLIIVAFGLTFIQSLQWICKGEVIEKDFKSLRLDINTMTELNELEKKSIFVLYIKNWLEKVYIHTMCARHTHTHTPNPRIILAMHSQPTHHHHSTRYEINCHSLLTRCSMGSLADIDVNSTQNNCTWGVFAPKKHVCSQPISS